nr:poly(A) RNA polymerase gld-2 homolog B [Aedes albopictus]XP_029727043.1 poly(A) RNA polymerase gld-2 homolog B [Aedes albopictus]
MSAKKMHPPAMVQTPIGSIASKANTLVVVSNSVGKGAKDRQNSENIVPASVQNRPAGEQVNSTKKLSNKAPPVVATIATTTPTVVSSNVVKTVQPNMNGGASVISTLNSTNRRKSHRLTSPNRRRREQQNVFNSLRAWDVKIVSSVQPTVAASQDEVGVKHEIQSAAQGVGSSSISNEASKAKCERSSSASSTTTSGSMSSSVSSNTSSSSCISSSSSVSNSINDNNGLSSKVKKRGVTVVAPTTVPCKEPAVADVVTIPQNVKKKEDSGNRTNVTNDGAKHIQSVPILQPVLTISTANGHCKVQGKKEESANRPSASNDGKQNIQNAPLVQPVLSISAPNGHSRVHGKVDKKLLNGSGGFGANHRHPAAAILPSHSSSSGSVIPSSSSSSTVVASLPSSASSVTRSSLTPPVMSTSSPAVLTSSPTNHPRHNTGVNTRSSNAGKVLLSNVNTLDPMTLLQSKLRGTMIGPQQQPPHHISHHHSNHSNLPGQSHQQQQQQQHNGQQMPPTTPPHYSLDFLHSVGMRMFTTSGTSQTANAASSAAASALLRANPHFNYNNFNQQLHQQQQQMIHQHQQHQQQQQPFHQMPRHYSNMYNCDDMLLQTSGGTGEPLYPSYPVSDHMMSGGAGVGTVGVNANDSGMAYCYSQNHQHHHQQQHNHSTHQQQQHHHHHQQQSYGSYHQNNNYQQHNRNYGRTGPGGGNLQNGGGKKTWNNNWHNGKKPIQGKYGNKGTSYNHGYRKNYHYYHNSHYGGGGGHYYDQNQNQQSESLRNLIYIKGYSNGQGPPESHGSMSRSPTPSPQSSSPPIEATEASQAIVPGKPVPHEEPSDSGIEETSSNHKKSSTVPSSSSSSSSMVSIPSTDSSAISASVAQNLSMELNCGNGQGYESDSSHSSSYNSHSYRHRKYANSGQVYRSSSSTSSGVSSTATFPPLNPDYHPSIPAMAASASNTPTAMNAQITDFFLRSQSYHGSHQNLTAVSASTSPHPPDSPVNTPRSIVGTQSMPMFSELFTGKQPSQQQLHQQQHSHLQKQQRSQPSSHYGSDNSLEITLPAGSEGSGSASVSPNTSGIASNCGSSGFTSAPAPTVPPNEALSMQSGHPKKRYSGRSSPVPYIAPVNQKPNPPPTSTQSDATTPSSQQLSPTSSDRKVQHPSAWDKPPTVSSELTMSPTGPPAFHIAPLSPNGINGTFMYPYDGMNMHTPADRFLTRAHLVELKTPPVELAPSGSKWASLSQAIWDKFVGAQQKEGKYVQKIKLWRYLFLNIRSAFPRLSLYMVGSSISGFASDSSDVDMCLVCRSNTVPFDMRGEALFQLGQLKNYFLNICTMFEEFSVIQAKVPILRFRDTANQIVFDLNFNNSVGIRNTHLLYLYSQMDWRLRPLTLVVKLWAQHHNINDAKNMTISSYSLVLMVIHFLQYGVNPPVLPCLHAMFPDKFVRMSDISTLDLMEKVEPYKNDNNSTLGELLEQFLEYYANFDYAHYAISVRTASVIPIESARVARSYKNDPHHWRQLCIEEPFDLTNTARSVFDADVFDQIKSVFSICWRRLKETNDLSSIFECEPLFIPVASALSITS